MKSFKQHTVSELKLIAKSWNHHMMIDYAKMKKGELVKALEEHLEHDEKGEIVLKKKNTFRLSILESEVLKFIKEHKDSSLKYHITRLYKHILKNKGQLKAEVDTGRIVEKLFNSVKSKSPEEKGDYITKGIEKYLETH